KTSLVRQWFGGRTNPIVFAVVIGRHTKIFPAEYRSDKDRTILIDDYEGWQDLRQYCMRFRPESVYYDRNIYASWEEARRGPSPIDELGRSFGQQLVFDIDPENFECPIHGTLEDKMRRRQGLSFCRLELQLAQEQALELIDFFFSSRRRHTICYRDWSSDVCSSDLAPATPITRLRLEHSPSFAPSTAARSALPPTLRWRPSIRASSLPCAPLARRSIACR